MKTNYSEINNGETITTASNAKGETMILVKNGNMIDCTINGKVMMSKPVAGSEEKMLAAYNAHHGKTAIHMGL